MFTAFELFLSDEVQSLIDHFAAVLDLRVTFFSADGRELRRGRHMRNSDYCAMVQQEIGTLKECLSMDTAKRAEAVAKRGIIDYRCHAGLRSAAAGWKVGSTRKCPIWWKRPRRRVMPISVLSTKCVAVPVTVSMT